MRTSIAIALSVLATACSTPTGVASLRDECPPPEFGRPVWVRWPARVGAWIGAGAGAVGSIALLPITWPVAQLADEPLGFAKDEFMFLPLSAGAAAGHFALGAPLDTVDWVARRAWVSSDPPTGYDYEPQPAPRGPEAAAGGGSEPTGR